MKNNRKNIFAALICLSVLIIAIGAVTIVSSGLTSASYKTVKPIENKVPVTISVSAELADTLEIREHIADKQPSGAYVLRPSTEVNPNETDAQSYFLLPGLNIPKDTFVRVKGKTEIPAYLYLEIIDTTASTYTYTVDSGKWSVLAGATGKYNGTVYRYKDILKKTSEGGENVTINIFDANNQNIIVSPDFDEAGNYSGDGLKFYAYMVQAVDGKEALDLFNSQIKTQ